ncbi:hypothetical protein GDO81_014015 [Engystomops pustulosus]|uniref:Uncharacterized protein n=1 Tax=Engystomops pustulosus TaxID=76066 RepID=A0AAV7B7K2_ENGPU|nr:hypothetical protein GDO81_014015 [Engystomops pustulosus]
MLLLGSVLVLLMLGARGLSQPYDNTMRRSQELSENQEEIKRLSGMTDSTESNSLELERAADNLQARCVNFYWKTFSECK